MHQWPVMHRCGARPASALSAPKSQPGNEKDTSATLFGRTHELDWDRAVDSWSWSPWRHRVDGPCVCGLAGDVSTCMFAAYIAKPKAILRCENLICRSKTREECSSITHKMAGKERTHELNVSEARSIYTWPGSKTCMRWLVLWWKSYLSLYK